jgi:site-specific recombinase XerD
MIALRYKKLASGKYSIYLDCYNEATRKRSYWFLKLQVTKDYSGGQKVAPQDNETMYKAMVELQNATGKLSENRTQAREKLSSIDKEGVVTLVSFLEKQLLEQPDNNTTALLNHIKVFLNTKDISLVRISPKWLDKFQGYLLGQLSSTTVSSNLMLLRTHLNQAVKQGLLKNNPFEGYPLKKGIPKERQFLTDEELNQLKHTTTTFNPQIRDAFLFACYCGMRWDDVKNLHQNQLLGAIEKDGKCFVIELKHIKSTRTYSVELSKKAAAIIEKYFSYERELVFDRLPNKSNCNIKLHLWGTMAGIDKNLCFSVARNTYALNLLKRGQLLKEVRKRIGLTNTYSAHIYEMMLSNENKQQS